MDYSIFGPSNSPLTLLAGDSLVIGRGGLLYGRKDLLTSQSDGTDLSISIEGGVTATNGYAIHLRGETDQFNGGNIYIGTEGYVSSVSYAISMSGGGAFVSNDGTISGGNAGLLLYRGRDARVTNTGSILGGAGEGVAVENSRDVSIANSGTIEGGVAGVRFRESNGEVVNLGSIVANKSTGIAINGGKASGSLEIDNSGSLFGRRAAIVGSAFNDKVVNSGSIRGNIELGGGDDIYRADTGMTDGYVGGESGDDTLIGGSGNDTLRGGDGDDALHGNAGDDFLAGGSGDDLFYFKLNGGNDTVADFQNGIDKLDLAAFHFTNFKEVAALARNTGDGLVLNFAGYSGSVSPYGEGTIFLHGMTRVQFDTTDVILTRHPEA